MGDEGFGRRCNIVEQSDVLEESSFDTFEEAMLLLELHPDKPYVMVPSMVAAGFEAPFEMRCAS